MRTQLALAPAVLGAVLAFLPTAESAAPKAVRVGLVNSLFNDDPDKQIKSIAEPLKSLMAELAGVEGEIVLGGDYAELTDQLKAGKVQLGVFNGLEFAWARAKDSNLKPLMIAVNHQPFAQSMLVVREDNKAADPSALKGKVLAVPQLTNEHCRIFVERQIVGDGTPVAKWFSKVSTPRTPQDALTDLVQGYADAAVVDDVDLAALRKTYPKIAAKVRVLKESAKFPCGVIAYLPGSVDQETLTKLTEGMIKAKDVERGRKLLELCRVTGFEKVPADYEQNLTDILKAYPAPMKK